MNCAACDQADAVAERVPARHIGTDEHDAEINASAADGHATEGAATPRALAGQEASEA
jgi:single CXXC unit